MSEPPKFNPYKILGVKINASEKTIKVAYRRLSKKYHPDQNPGDESATNKYQEVQEAWDAIGTPEARAYWDTTGEVKSKTADEELPGFVENIIVPAMHQILQNFHNYKFTDLIELIRKDIRTGLANGRSSISEAEKLRDRLLETAKRIRRKEGDNILAGIVETEARERDRSIDKMKKGILHLEECLLWLKDYSYMIDPFDLHSRGYGFTGKFIPNTWGANWPELNAPSKPPGEQP